MQVNVLIFGQLAGVIGNGSIIVNDIGDTEGLKDFLQQQYPGLAEMPYLIAVDKEVVPDNTSLNHNSIVALLPPYAGG